MKFHKILVPTDFSKDADRALQYAIDLARTSGGEIVLAHVLELLTYPTVVGIDPISPQIQKELRDNMSRALEALRAREIPKEIRSRALMLDGRPYWRIVEAAREQQVDLIVIATRGNTGLKHMLLGSTAEHVVREAPCPVLVVRGVEQKGDRR
jgi:nucleotide-binding universal stress UspA family protein